jgi:hypothetical protein
MWQAMQFVGVVAVESIFGPNVNVKNDFIYIK